MAHGETLDYTNIKAIMVGHILSSFENCFWSQYKSHPQKLMLVSLIVSK